MLKKLLPSLLFFLITFISFGQAWKGKVIDKNGDPLPFVNVYFEGTSIGTTSNMDGEFSLNQPTGKNILVFQFVGYERKKLDLSAKSADEKLKVTLNDQALQIKEVTVAGYKKDPAYYIIKQAQKKRKYYLNQVESYSCKIYMKGTTRLVEKPKEIPGFIKISMGDDDKKELDSLKTGLLSLSESFANVSYSKKDGYKEEMLASKVSGSSQSFSWNRAQDVLANFYEDRQHMAGLNERGFVSPIAPDALLFYDYKLLGTFEEDGRTVNRIQVTPKRKTDPVFNGTIYITEELWNIHSLKLKVSKDAQIEFIDSIDINQSFTRIENDVFMPLSLQMTYHFGLFGFRANYDAVGNISEYDLGKINLKFAKNQVFAVDKNANKQDSAYWNDVRPVVLNTEEKENLYKGDSLKAVYTSKAYLDSVDRVSNKLKAGKVIIGGYSYYQRYDSLTYEVNSLFNALRYTSIDGVSLELRPKRIRQTRHGNITNELGLRYGFASNRPGIKFKHSQLFNKRNYYNHFIEGGYFTYQINEQEPIDPLLNSLYTLIDGKNFGQFYQKAFIKAGAGREIVNGITLNASAEYAYRQNLNNAATYNFNEQKLYNIANKDAGPSKDQGPFDTWNVGSAIKMHLGARIAFKQKFAEYPDVKVNYRSKYPKLKLDYELGIVPSSNPITANTWNLVQAEIYDRVPLGMIGAGEYSLKAGTFLGEKPKNFVDFKHFIGNQTVVIHNENNAFQNLPYYSYSTNGSFIEAHYEHHFYGFILNKIPLIKKLKWKEVAGVNFLYTQTNKEYTEVYVGIDNIFNFFKIQFVSYYQKGEPLKPALRLGLRIG